MINMENEPMFPKEYELTIQFLDQNDEVDVETFKYRTMSEVFQTIKHHRLPKDFEILKYEINVNKVLF